MLGKVHDGPFLSGNHVGDITTQLSFVGKKEMFNFSERKKAVRLSLQGWVD